jgi:integrase
MNRGHGRVYRPKFKDHTTGQWKQGNIWWIGFYFAGEQRRESSGSKNRIDALKLLRRRLGEMGSGNLIAADAERLKFTEITEMIRDDYAMNGRKSITRMERAIKSLSTVFSLFRALDITTDRITHYIKQRQSEGVAAASIRYEMSILKRMFSLAVRAEKLHRRPYIPSIEVRNTRGFFFTDAEFQALLPHLPNNVQPLIEFLWLTGWRVGECRGLLWRNVDWKAKTVRLEPGTTKNDEGRIFPFGSYPELEKLLLDCWQETEALQRSTAQFIPYVFHRNGQPIKQFKDSWKSACKKASLQNRWVHDFRRAFVKRAESSGVPRSWAMKLVGHKTPSIYARYCIVSEADLSEGVARLAAKIPSPSEGRSTALVAIEQHR